MRHATDRREIAKVLSCVMAIAVIDNAAQCAIQTDSCPQLLLFMRLMAGNNVQNSLLRNRSSVVSLSAGVWKFGEADLQRRITTLLLFYCL